MLRRTHSAHAPWHIVRVNDKYAARLNLIRHLLAQLHHGGKDRRLVVFDPAVVFLFHETRLCDGSMAKLRIGAGASCWQPVAEVLLRSSRVGGNGHDQDGKSISGAATRMIATASAV